MRGAALTLLFTGAVVLTVASCTETHSPQSGDGDIAGVEAAAVVPGNCDLIKSLAADARDYFSNPERRTAGDLVQSLGIACKDGDQPQVTSLAWQVLALMETVLTNGTAGSAVIGVRLATGLLACTTSLCVAAEQPAIDLAGAFSPYGLFSIHSTDTNPAIARGAVPFLDFNGNANTALWGVEVDQPWETVTNANPVLVYGNPVTAGGVPLQDVSIGDLQYSLNVFPDAGEFDDETLHVGVCFGAEVALPVVAGIDAQPRMQRQGVLLEEHTPGFCQSSAPQQASLLSPILAVARLLMPASLEAALGFGHGAVVVGGTPLDFSTFAPVAANVAGTLEYVVAPNPNPVAGQPMGEIQIRARSGAGTPMEKVKVTLYILNNLGIPAGAELSGDLESLTQERNGQIGIATFPDDGTFVTIGKAGGYRLCGRGELGGFTFTDVCTNLNVRNN